MFFYDYAMTMTDIYPEIKMEAGWKEALSEEFGKPYFRRLTDFVRAEYSRPDVRVFPPASLIFAAFDSTPFNKTKVVILGQDPYHGPGQANGLAFSVNRGIALPPSLRNIFKEISDETGKPPRTDGDLSAWANSGVLLLNTSLTVREHSPRSHAGIGWETLTDAALRALSERRENIVYMLWGSDAIRKKELIDVSKNLLLTSPHPSPLSAFRGFFGNGHFKLANDYLVAHGDSPIEW